MKLTLKFKTSRVLTQEEGMAMWELGQHFVALTGSGGKTYQLITEPRLVEDSITDTINAAMAAVTAALPAVSAVVLVGVAAELMPAEMPVLVTTLTPASG